MLDTTRMLMSVTCSMGRTDLEAQRVVRGGAILWGDFVVDLEMTVDRVPAKGFEMITLHRSAVTVAY